MRNIPGLKVSNDMMDELEKMAICEGIPTHYSTDGRIWPPPPLHVPQSLISDGCFREGDIVTLGAAGNPARDQRTGIPVPVGQRFVIRAKEDE